MIFISGDKVSGTVKLMLWDAELLYSAGGGDARVMRCLDGTHDDPYIMEATQTWYWVLFCRSGDGKISILICATGPQISIPDPGQLHVNVDRLVARW